MRVEVIHHDGHVISVGKVHRQQLFHAMCPVDFRSPIRDSHMAPPFKRSKQHKQIAHTLAFIFIIVALRLARVGWQRLTGFTDLLFARLIHTNERVLRRIRAMVDIKHIFHAPDKFSIGLWRDAPLLFQPRFKLAFFKC
jgi:hypothetical protein